MPIQTINTFQNVTATVEDIVNPEKPEDGLHGRAIVIIDQETSDVWRIPMPLEVAETVGKRLQGGTAVEVATPSQADAVAKKAAAVTRLNTRPKR